MADSDSSSSSSGSGSASSSRSPSPSVSLTNSSTQRLNPSNNTSNTSSYIPPPLYEPASFSDALTLEDIKSASSKGKQIWTIKIPDGVHPSLLEGLVFDLPPTSSSSSGSSSLGSLKTSTRDPTTGEKKSSEVYHLYHSNPSQPVQDEAKNAKPGLKGKKAKKQGDKSQLVQEQEQQQEVGEGNNLGAHMNGLRAYVAVPGGKPGQISAAPLPISHHLEFVLATPDATTSSKHKKEHKVESDPEPRPTTSKLRELKGYFAPSGSLYDDDEQLSTTEVVDAKDKSKKRKKDQTEADSVTASSPNSKSKKVKVKDEDSKKKDKDKKKSSKHAK
ncbi:unnamed protein product [Sympodiomycopsis kandeliae]